ncbi:MAG: hypothetical protein IJT61_01735, partial [Bacteroidales bacterium]|nr:hypothetical protein [Bacteroidales bacterium]
MKRIATIVSIAAAVCWLLFVLLRLFLGEDVFLAYRLEGLLLVVATLLVSLSVAFWIAVWMKGKHFLLKLLLWLLYIPITLIWLLVVFIVDVMVTHTAPFDSHFEYKVCSNDTNYVVRGKFDDTFELIYLYHRDGILERPVCWLDRYYNAYIEDLVVYENDDLVLFQYHHSECTSRTDTFHLDGSLY